MDEYYQVVQALTPMAGKAAGAATRQKMRKLYMSCASGWAVLHSLRYEDAAARLHSWHLN